MPRDPYIVLGLTRDADGDAIKKAYRHLALQHHPDRNPGDAGAAERFQEVAGAYAILSDPVKRAKFDHSGVAGKISAEDLLAMFAQFFGGDLHPGSPNPNCSLCHGAGTIQHTQGMFSVRVSCPACNLTPPAQGTP